MNVSWPDQDPGRPPGAIVARLRRVLFVVVLTLLAGQPVAARNCGPEEVTFKFTTLEVREAFAILADFANLRADVDQTLTQSEPMNFTCVNWRVAAQDLARRHNLVLTIQDGVLTVRRQGRES